MPTTIPADTWRLLTDAAKVVRPDQFSGYFELRSLLANPSPRTKAAFKRRFVAYYRLGSAGLTPEFRDRFFEHLFACSPKGQPDPYTNILADLHTLPRRQGDYALQASFVSKLVAIHDESRPIYDRHVRDFFGMGAPACGSVPFRIAGFVANLRRIQAEYERWAADSRFAALRARFSRMHSGAECHDNRLCDFLVWKIGAEKLYGE